MAAPGFSVCWHIRTLIPANVSSFLRRDQVIHVVSKLPAFFAAYPDMAVEMAASESLATIIDDGYDLAIYYGDLSRIRCGAMLQPSAIGHPLHPAQRPVQCHQEHPADAELRTGNHCGREGFCGRARAISGLRPALQLDCRGHLSNQEWRSSRTLGCDPKRGYTRTIKEWSTNGSVTSSRPKSVPEELAIAYC